MSGIEVTLSMPDSISFELGNGLKPGDPQESVIEKMGQPTDTNEQDSYTEFVYGDDEETGQISFLWGKEDPSWYQISLAYYPAEETTTSTEVPEYLSGYAAPSAMGDDFDSGTFTLDGVIYQMPCPVSELVKNGWAIEDDEPVMAGRVGVIYLKKGDSELTISVRNYADYQTPASNCVIYSVSAYSYYFAPASELILPKGISFSTDLDTLQSAIDSSSFSLEKEDDESSVTYFYYDYDLDFEVYISYSITDNSITSLKLERDTKPW